MLSLWDVCAGVLWPAAVTAVLLLASWRFTRHRLSARESRSWAGPALVALGLIAGYAALFGWPELPPADAVDWLFWVAWPLAGLGILATRGVLGFVGRALCAAMTVPATNLLLAWPVLASPTAHNGLVVFVMSLLGVALLITGGGLATRMSALRLAGLLLITTLCGGLTLALAGSLRLGQVGWILAGTQAGAIVALVWMGHAARGRGVMLVFGPLWTGLLLCGVLYSSLATVEALLLLGAPSAALLVQQSHPRPARQVRRAILQIGIVALVGSLAVLHAWWSR